MRQRSDTRRSYEVWLRNNIVPKWGDRVLSDVQARPVELWIESLALAPKSKVHIRGVLSILWDFAMWRGDVATERNPMELVRIKGATKRTRKPRSLMVQEFQRLIRHLDEPFRRRCGTSKCVGSPAPQWSATNNYAERCPDGRRTLSYDYFRVAGDSTRTADGSSFLAAMPFLGACS